jgi:hypothetical protein
MKRVNTVRAGMAMRQRGDLRQYARIHGTHHGLSGSANSRCMSIEMVTARAQLEVGHLSRRGGLARQRQHEPQADQDRPAIAPAASSAVIARSGSSCRPDRCRGRRRA